MTTQGSLNRGRRSVLDGAPQKTRPGQQESKAGGRAGGERKSRAEDVVLTGEARKKEDRQGGQAGTHMQGRAPAILSFMWQARDHNVLPTECASDHHTINACLLRAAACCCCCCCCHAACSHPVQSSPVQPTVRPVIGNSQSSTKRQHQCGCGDPPLSPRSSPCVSMTVLAVAVGRSLQESPAPLHHLDASTPFSWRAIIEPWTPSAGAVVVLA